MQLDPQRQKWFEAACARLDMRRMRRFNQKIAAIHSPTGRERPLAEYLVEYVRGHGADAAYQPMTEMSGNASARLASAQTGPSLLLYAPIDTHLEADPETELPWVGPKLRQDMLPIPGDAPLVDDPEQLVIGLGASNPKSMVTALTETFIAIKEAGVPLSGDLLLGFAGGGMPVNVDGGRHRGLGDGVFHMLTRGLSADFAVVMKPYNNVYHEEPGLCWFKVTVHGTMGYAGMSRDRKGFSSAIVPAARFILAIEEWLARYPHENTVGQVAPQGWVSAVRAGWPEKPAFPSAATEIYIDLRCAPHLTPADVKAQFAAAVRAIVANDPGINLTWEMCAAYPGASTPPDNWIIRSAIRGWERVEGREHGTPLPRSGQTDISTLRNLQIPTARIGWNSPPQATPPEFLEGLGGMGVSYIPDLVPACRKILYVIIDTCTRSRKEVGLTEYGNA